jgi:hypothetical protein
MSKTRKLRLKLAIAGLAAVAASAVAAGAVAAGAVAAHPLPQAHHALADDGVINSKN